jgi:hypothetical protein
MLGWKLVTLVERVRMSHDDTLSSGGFRVNNAHTIANGLAILGMDQVHERVFHRKVNSKAVLEDKGRGITFSNVRLFRSLNPTGYQHRKAISRSCTTSSFRTSDFGETVESIIRLRAR